MWRLCLTILTIIHNFRFTDSLNCDQLQRAPDQEGNGTATSNVQYVPELEGADFKELVSCLATLGKEPLSQDQANNVWSSLKKYYSRIEDIPTECFAFMGYALIGIPVDDFQNITLDNIDIVAVFGKYHGLKQEQMMAVVEGIIRDWTEKVPVTLSEFDLIAMGQILCHFNKTDISRIHPSAYKGAAQVIGELQDCPPEINQSFAGLAVQRTAFGPPQSWSQYDLAVIGNVLTGLPPEAYAQIPEEFLKDMEEKKKKKKSSTTTRE